MPLRGRRPARPIRRRGPTRQPRQRILVVCEGEVTEPRYIDALRRHARNPLVEVKVASETGAPLTLVTIAMRLKQEAEVEARRQRDDNLRWDQVWGVFDVDEHARLDEAKGLAESASIRLAVSNPCFELWALLHFRDQRAYIERGRVQSELQRHMPGYDKELDFVRMHPTYAEAARRAEELDRLAVTDGEAGRNPSTQVYRLTAVILAT